MWRPCRSHRSEVEDHLYEFVSTVTEPAEFGGYRFGGDDEIICDEADPFGRGDPHFWVRSEDVHGAKEV